ncbi:MULTISPECIES: phosphate ABC transporter permease PstA [unclassified Methylophaga]|jgi:phosphate transport system permease protein|uniref:phosphate ABC transporter permease PstA n=1 Tax=unclassified Methylophaga TaxID=2629249 RepID=UPI000C8ECCAE|nr:MULTISPECIES: phosphate ABC transporter permease PstA [unclassified Methylophaga]MAP27604.1 phosphate ABC transporter, permease protein PstA [Methylophaga sp.]HCN99941.1 phosphate ABC transporter permease PtsA [Methylophaga sp.]|tara:strand:- start:3264 stop:4931 length:1668 start_codon:yes stop_codon:yes gene_type:complete
MSNSTFKSWYQSGSPWVWLNAGAVSISLIAVIGLVLLIAVRGLSHFWPADIMSVEYNEPGLEPTVLIGERVDHEVVPAERVPSDYQLKEGQISVERYLLKIGNRDQFGLDFRWINKDWMGEVSYPEDILSIERREWGHFYGYLLSVQQQGETVADGEQAWPEFQQRLDRSNNLVAEIKYIEKIEIGKINQALESLRLDERRLELDNVPEDNAAYAEIEAARAVQNEKYAKLQIRLSELSQALIRDQVVMQMSNGDEVVIPMAKIVDVVKPNDMNRFEKLQHYFHEVWKFISGEPREANTEGGIFPAIFGTVMMVLIMSVIVTPFGVIAAIYLKEYAKQGVITRTIRIAVNNLAGVPSIVYGVFGLGFFVYFLGGNIDEIFFQAKLPSPTFGQPGLMWASLTLAILTVPVVIVATEEGLSRIPRAMREGSLALGATKAETLWRTVIPMAAPAMMTGLILAVARAAGEVAPLMMVGVVKLAPALAVDSVAPYLHLDRQFMHLGFHIYDVGFQSPNVEAARPLVYATAFLLLLIIVVLNLTAISIRNRLRENFKASDN